MQIDKRKRSGLYFTLMLLIYLIVSLIGGIIMLLINADDFTFTLVSALFSPLAFIITAILLKEQNERLVKPFIKKKISIKILLASFLISLGMIFGLGYVNVYFLEILKSISISAPTINLPKGNIFIYFICVLFIAIIPAIFEEYFFRGILIDKLKGFGKGFAIIISALLFSLFHGSLAQLIYQFIYGVILGFIALKSANILNTILIHFLNNFLVLTFDFLEFYPFSNPLFIIIGACLLMLGLLLVFLSKDNLSYTKDKKAVDFFIPFGTLGIIFSVLLIVLGAVYG